MINPGMAVLTAGKVLRINPVSTAKHQNKGATSTWRKSYLINMLAIYER
jgi:hypothetical protein